MKKPKPRADGRYQIKVSLGTDSTGKRIQKFVYDEDWEECKRKAERLRLSYGKIEDISLIYASYNSVVNLYIETEKGQNTPSIVKTKEFRAKYFSDYFGNVPLADIKPYQIQIALQALVAAGRSDKTVKEYLAVVRQVFNFAFENGIIEASPVSRVKVPTGKPKEQRRALTKEERRRIVDLPQGQAKTVAMLGLFAGLRRGEIAALRWNDVNFEKGEIIVARSYDYKHREFKAPKTAAGVRTVPLFAQLESYLKALPKKSIYVAGDLTKSQNRFDKLHTETFKIFERKYGNPDVVPVQIGSAYFFNTTVPTWGYHELRHTFCTMLFEIGCSVVEAAAILGHAQVSTTQEIYTHLLAERKQETFEKLKKEMNGV